MKQVTRAKAWMTKRDFRSFWAVTLEQTVLSSFPALQTATLPPRSLRETTFVQKLREPVSHPLQLRADQPDDHLATVYSVSILDAVRLGPKSYPDTCQVALRSRADVVRRRQLVVVPHSRKTQQRTEAFELGKDDLT